MLTTERFAPSFAGKGAFGPPFRLSIAVGVTAGLGLVYQRSCLRFYGWMENEREQEMDMREMVDKVKKGEPLYGESQLSPYMQGVAARNSRFSALMFHIVPMANFTNHNQVSHKSCCSVGLVLTILYSTASTLLNTTSRQRGNWRQHEEGSEQGRPV